MRQEKRHRQILHRKYTYLSTPPQFNKHLFKYKPSKHETFTLHSIIKESKLACDFTKRTVLPAILPPTDNIRHHFFAPLLSFIYKIQKPAATLLEQALLPLSHHLPLSGKQQKIKVNSTILHLFPTPQTTILHMKEETKTKAPDIENGHSTTTSRIILKNEKHVPHASYIDTHASYK